jgi:hypothetical protein
MDPAGIGALIGVGIMAFCAVTVCIYDRCKKPSKQTVAVTNPLLMKKRSFKVKNLFSHVEI